jgi:hypothetical protein
MGFFDSIKDKAEDLAGDAERAGKVGAAQVKLKSLQGDVKEAMEKLGREAFELIEKGELTHPGLDAAIAKVRDAKKIVADKETEIKTLKAED